ncbi:MAG: cobalt-precorrin-5B (C(1))-methyltransferase, partial [Synechococcales cyanobacterium RM1_1_8]|nr:cobalt-precorrin-5B (C(1))-methyltransferase [Synechococcales cyanobacterium RM1_1_8]
MGHSESADTPRSGYTLPVFACAGAIAALQHLLNHRTATATLPETQTTMAEVTLNLLEPAQPATIAIEQLARLGETTALAITRSDPGDNLDLTRNTPIWSQVELNPVGQSERLAIAGGEGIGKQLGRAGQAAIYSYAQRLLRENLLPLLPPGTRVKVTITLPEGRALALRTSNAAFGVVDGLSLLGTSGIAQPLSAPGQLEDYREQLRAKAAAFDGLVFCIGENGLALAPELGFDPQRLVKTANWLGPLLAEAGLLGVKQILLLGYHGKLIKLAAGIFHTHHHVADGRMETLCAIAAAQNLPHALLQQLLDSPTVEAGLGLLKQADSVMSVYDAIAQRLDRRAADYIRKQSDVQVKVGSILFDRQRRIIVTS